MTEAFPEYHDAPKPPPTKVVDSRAIPRPAIVAVGAASIAVIALVVTITVILTNRRGPNPSPTAAPPTTTMLVTTPSSPPATVTVTVPPPASRAPSTTSQRVTAVAPDTLQGLLRSPDQISDAVGATGMRVATTYTTMKDLKAQLSDEACLPLADPADAAVYAGSGWYAMRGQGLDERTWTHLAYQNVVLFSSAYDASTFFTASAQRWPACSNGPYTVTAAGKPVQVWSVGPVFNTNGTLSATKTQVLGEGWTCQRALTVANNVAIDIDACSKERYDIDRPFAVTIAQQIAAKVPPT